MVSHTERPLLGCELALTIDDAPSRPGHMDAALDALRDAGVEHCVAFVVGGWIAGMEGVLRRWLEAGYELGNHTWSHLRCSEHDPAAFVADARRCDQALAQLGAFAGDRPRYFRFPYLDRGRAEHRPDLRRAFADLGYRTVHGSIDWFDYHYDVCLEQVPPASAAAAAIEQRYVETALATTRFEVARARDRLGHPMRHIAYGHFGESTARCLPRLLRGLLAAGVTFGPLDGALDQELFAAFEREPRANGRVPPALFPRGLAGSVRRAWARGSWSLGLFGQRRLGPRWPMFLE